MEVEHQVKVIQLDADFEAHVKAMAAEGWLMVPGITPVAVYHMVRMKGMMPNGDQKPVVQIAVDDTKVQILRNGQLVDGC